MEYQKLRDTLERHGTDPEKLSMLPQVLQTILEIGGIEDKQLAIFADGLAKVYDDYEIATLLNCITPARRIANICGRISVLAAKLMELLDENSASGGEIQVLLGALGVNTREVSSMLHRLDFAASGACRFMRTPDDDRDSDGDDADTDGDDPDTDGDGPDTDGDGSHSDGDESSLEDLGIKVVISGSRGLTRGKREAPRTRLFINLRDLFVSLGGTTAIGSGGPLYRFVSACVENFGGVLMPKPEPFRILMMNALKRRQHAACKNNV